MVEEAESLDLLERNREFENPSRRKGILRHTTKQALVNRFKSKSSRAQTSSSLPALIANGKIRKYLSSMPALC